MSLRSKAMLKLAKARPQLVLIPLIPFGLTVSSFVMSFLALRKARRLTLQSSHG